MSTTTLTAKDFETVDEANAAAIEAMNERDKAQRWAA